jgi:hypothetical protein
LSPDFERPDALARFHRALVEEILRTRPAYLREPFTVAEIYQNLVPYRTHRDRIGVDMNGDYEDALLRLLAGEGEYLLLESEHARTEISDELSSPNPNTGLYREFAAVDVRLNPLRMPRDLPDPVMGSTPPFVPPDVDFGAHGHPVTRATPSRVRTGVAATASRGGAALGRAADANGSGASRPAVRSRRCVAPGRGGARRLPMVPRAASAPAQRALLSVLRGRSPDRALLHVWNGARRRLALLRGMRDSGGGRRLIWRFGPAVGLVLLVALGSACQKKDASLQPDAVLRDSLGLGDEDRVHRVQTVEPRQPRDRRARVGSRCGRATIVEFMTTDRACTRLVLLDSLPRAAPTSCASTSQESSPPLLEPEARFLVTFESAPVGRYPFVISGNGAEARGAIVVRSRRGR